MKTLNSSFFSALILNLNPLLWYCSIDLIQHRIRLKMWTNLKSWSIKLVCINLLWNLQSSIAKQTVTTLLLLLLLLLLFSKHTFIRWMRKDCGWMKAQLWKYLEASILNSNLFNLNLATARLINNMLSNVLLDSSVQQKTLTIKLNTTSINFA